MAWGDMTATGETRSPIPDGRLLRERVATLYATGWLMTGGNIFAALCVLVMMRDIAPSGVVIGWPAALVALALVRAAIFVRYREVAGGVHSPAFWGALYTANSIALGLTWGLVVSYLALDAPTRELAIMIGIATMTVIAGAGNAVYPWAYLGYTTTVTLPIVAALLRRGEESGFELAAFVTVIYLVGLLLGRRLGEIMTVSLRLRLANADLIAHLKSAFERAEAASEAKSRFLANMSHELRTPLNAVIGYSEMLVEDAKTEGRAQVIADLEKISSAGRQLLALVNEVLDLAKVESGRMDLIVERFDLAALIDEVVGTVRPLVERNGNTLGVERAAELGLVVADGAKLRQVLLNLLSNAAKFTEKGRIVLKASAELVDGRSWLVIAVSDTGIGISADGLARLFVDFSQADAAIAVKYGGTGLGLALSQKLARLMGGEIAAESAPGRGSCFTLRIPASLIAAGAAATPDIAARV